MLSPDYCANKNHMHTEYFIPVMLCVAGLILLTDFLPIEAECPPEWRSRAGNPDQNPDYEDDFAMSEDIRNANHTNTGATTASSI